MSAIVTNERLFPLISDGAGRSGVYVTIDANIELSEEDGVFDVYGYLKKIRQQRRGLVESLVSQDREYGAHKRRLIGMDILHVQQTSSRICAYSFSYGILFCFSRINTSSFMRPFWNTPEGLILDFPFRNYLRKSKREESRTKRLKRTLTNWNTWY